MTELETITYAGGLYLDRGRFLETGHVKPAGFKLRTHVVGDIGALFRAAARGLDDTAYDACEMSLATYISMVARGDKRLVAIPAFPSRAFRHGQVYVRADRDIAGPADLRGRRVGVAEYRQTAAVWVRAFLFHDYGVAPEDVEWVIGGLRSPGYLPRDSSALPESLAVGLAPTDATLEDMLLNGDLDALVTVREPRGYARSDGGIIRRLFSDHRAVELDYFRRTGILPIMHTVVLRSDLNDRLPWVARELLDAFEADRSAARDRHLDSGMPSIMHPWISDETASLDANLSHDPFQYGFQSNKHVVGALCEYLHEQGLADRIAMPEELFATETVTT